MEQQQLSPDTNMETASANRRAERVSKAGKWSTQRNLLPSEKKQYNVKENAIKGVYVQNLSEITCATVEQAYWCLLDGLMRKRMS